MLIDEFEFGDLGPPLEPTKERKSDRRCNNCGERLTENAPNWFQCSEECRKELYARNNPRYDDD